MNELSDPEQLIMGVMTLIEENVNENNRLSQRRPVTGVCVWAATAPTGAP